MTTKIIGRGHIIESILDSSRKLTAALKTYNGHAGNQTIQHIERNIAAQWATAPHDLTGKQYGLLLNVANQSYHSGRASKRIDTWAYDSEYDWLAGYRNKDNEELIITVDNDTITIRKYAYTDKEQTRTYKLINN